MLMVGLTGGIGSGKSSVSAMFKALGARIIDADALAREALEPGMPAYAETVRMFGRRILGSDGRVDRKALGGIVFGDADKRRALEAVVHPRVLAEQSRIAAEAAASRPRSIVFFDAALLIESGTHERMDRVVVVWCRPETQLRRLVEDCGMSEDDALLRINAQMPIDEKRKYADYIVDNDGGLDEAAAQVERIYRELAQYV